MKKTHFLLLVAVFAAVGSMLFIGGIQQAHATCANIGSDPDAPLHPEILRSPQFDASYSPWTTFDGYSQTPVSVTAGTGAPLLLWANNNMLDCLSEVYNGTTAIGVRPDSTPNPRRLVVKLYQQVNPGTFNLPADTLIYPDLVDPNTNPETNPTSWQINMNNSGAGSQGDIQLLPNNKGFKMHTPAGGSPTKEFIGSIYFGNSLVGKSGLYLAVELWEDNPSLGGWIMTGGTVLVPISITSGTPASLSLSVDKTSVPVNTPYNFSLSGSNMQSGISITGSGGYAKSGLSLGTNVASDQQSSAGSYTYSASGKDTSGNTVNSNNVTVAVTAGAGNPSCTASAIPASGAAPLTTNLTGTPSGGSGTYTSYAWSFGDGGTATTKTASHTYTSAGTYTAKLTVTDSNNNTGSCTTNVSVGPTCTDTTWTPDPSTQCNGVSFQQTSNCNNTRSVTGSATCYACSGSSCNAVPSGTSGYTSSDCNNTCSSVTTYNCNTSYQCVSVSGSGGTWSTLSGCQTACVAPPTGSCSLTASPTSGPQPLSTTFTISGANSNATYGYIYNGSAPVSGQINLSGGSGSKTLTLSAPGGSYYFADWDNNGNMYDTQCGFPTTVTVYQPTFTLSPSSSTIQVGGTQQFTGNYDPDGPSGPATSSAVAATSVTWTSSNTAVATTTSSGVATGVAAGSTTIYGTYKHIQASALLTVNSASNPDFAVAVTPSLQGVNQGSFVDYNVTVTPINGFTGTVNLSVSSWGNGSGLSGSFDPSSVTITSGMPAVGSTLAISAAANAAPGRSTFTVLGKSGTNSKQASADVEVVQANRYSCNSNYQCILDSSGTFSDVASCQTACVRPSCSLYPQPSNILRGMSSQLTWTCSGSGISATTTCLLKGPSGSVASGLTVNSGVSGVFVKPAQTTQYTLTCGGASSQATVNVGFFPLLREIIPQW